MPQTVVVGTGRCGTMSAARALDAEHEPNQNPTVYLAMAYSHGWMKWNSCAVAMQQFDWPERISDHRQSELIDVTARVWPGIEFVWMVRNPADTIASMVANGWYKPSDDIYPPGYLTIYHDGPVFESVGKMTMINSPGNRTRGDIVGDFTFQEWSDMGQVERCGWWWNFCNRRIAEQLKATGAKTHLIRLENTDWPTSNQSEAKPVYGWEPYVEEMADALDY